MEHNWKLTKSMNQQETYKNPKVKKSGGGVKRASFGESLFLKVKLAQNSLSWAVLQKYEYHTECCDESRLADSDSCTWFFHTVQVFDVLVGLKSGECKHFRHRDIHLLNFDFSSLTNCLLLFETANESFSSKSQSTNELFGSVSLGVTFYQCKAFCTLFRSKVLNDSTGQIHIWWHQAIIKLMLWGLDPLAILRVPGWACTTFLQSRSKWPS